MFTLIHKVQQDLLIITILTIIHKLQEEHHFQCKDFLCLFNITPYVHGVANQINCRLTIVAIKCIFILTWKKCYDMSNNVCSFEGFLFRFYYNYVVMLHLRHLIYFTGTCTRCLFS